MKYILIFISFCIITIVTMFAFIEQHEEVHKKIFNDYGIDSKIYLFKFPNAYTKPESNCEDKECLLAHEINESIGYQLQPFYFMVAVGLIFIIGLMLYIIHLKEKENEV